MGLRCSKTELCFKTVLVSHWSLGQLFFLAHNRQHAQGKLGERRKKKTYTFAACCPLQLWYLQPTTLQEHFTKERTGIFHDALTLGVKQKILLDDVSSPPDHVVKVKQAIQFHSTFYSEVELHLPVPMEFNNL